jgi:circadian clock protein KaiB
MEPARVSLPERSKVATVQERPPNLRLRLYVAGRAPNSVRAIANCRAICAEHFATAHELEIVDLLEHPKRALADGVIVTPTLLKLLPLPAQRVIGNLSDTNQVLLALSGR